MRIIEPSIEILTPINGDEILKHIELCGRTCYKSHDLITDDSAKRFVASIIKSGHESVLEHYAISIKLITDRGVMAELTRHRTGVGFSIESTRYVNYSKKKCNGELTFIKPCFFEFDTLPLAIWKNAMDFIENEYLSLIDIGSKPEEARSILPNSLATEIIMTANLRELRHILKLRIAKEAHPEMRKVMKMLLLELQSKIQIIFDNIEVR